MMNAGWLKDEAAFIAALGTLLVGIAALLAQIRTTKRKNRILFSIGVLSLAFSSVVFFARLSSRKDLPSVEITYPQKGQSVERTIDVHGRKRNMPQDREVWVFVKSAKTDYHLYPTSSSDPSGEGWQADVCVDHPESSETEFTIFACPVEPQARGILLEDHRLPCEKSLRQLPSTIQMSECSKRTVYLEPQTSPPVETR